LPALHAVSGALKLAYSQFEEMEVFARFGTRLDERTQKILDRGHRTRTLLLQQEYTPLTAIEQILILTALNDGLFDPVPLDHISEAESAIRAAARALPADLLTRLESSKPFGSDERAAVIAAARVCLGGFLQSNGSHEQQDAK
jgi:F-type H+-transporting ATPase subunit alpha